MPLLLVLACEPDHSGDGLRGCLTTARLEDVQIQTWFLFGGAVDGAALLVVGDEEGQEHEAIVSIDGALVGGVVEGSLAVGGPVPMFLPDAGVQAVDLMSVYTGVASSVAAGAGLSTHHLENERGVQIDVALFELGVGARVAFEALGLTQEAAFTPRGDRADSGGAE